MYKVIDTNDNKEYALKKISIETSDLTPSETMQELETQLNEIRVISSLQHKNIVKYYNSWVEVLLKRKPKRNKETSERILINNIVYWYIFLNLVSMM